jgi:hypothetical protein
MSESSSATPEPVRRRDLHRRRSSLLSRGHAPKRPIRQSQTAASPSPAAGGDGRRGTRRGTFAAPGSHGRRGRRSGDRAFRVRPQHSVPLTLRKTGRGQRRASRGGRGSNGSLLRSVRKQRIRDDVDPDRRGRVAGGPRPRRPLLASSPRCRSRGQDRPHGPPVSRRAVSPEKVDAQVSGSKGSSLGRGRCAEREAEERRGPPAAPSRRAPLPGCDAEQDFDKSVSNGELPEEWAVRSGNRGSPAARGTPRSSFAKMNAAYKKGHRQGTRDHRLLP